MFRKPTLIVTLAAALAGACGAPPAPEAAPTVICEPEARSCSGNDVVACHTAGTSWDFFKACREFGPCIAGVCSKEPGLGDDSTPAEGDGDAGDGDAPGDIVDPAPDATPDPEVEPDVDPSDDPTPDPGDDPGVTPDPDPGIEPEPCVCAGRQVCEDGVCGEPEVCLADVDCIGEGRGCVEGRCRSICAGADDCFGDFICDPESRRCQPPEGCLRDGCPDGGRCDGSTGQCTAPEAVECNLSADCPGAQGCRAGTCVEPVRCEAAADCLGDRICEQGECIDSCAQIGCPGALRCDEALGICAERAICGGDDGCLEGRVCVAGACIDACAEHADCPGAQVCDGGQCVDAGFCLLDADCGARRICEGGACTDSCAVAGCIGGGECDVASGRCQGDLGCIEAADCPGALTCSAGACVEPANCAADAGCLPGRVCRAGACTDLCQFNAECGDGLACLDGVCAAPQEGCQVDGDCGNGLRCADGECFAPECEAHAECEQGFCTDFACAEQVEGRCDCEDGWDCRDGRCLQPGPCEADVDCPGNTCLVNVGACATLCDGPDCGGDEACEEDRFFPNDSPIDAIGIGAMHLSELSACAGAADWFRISTDSAFSAIARFDRNGQPVTVRLYARDALSGTLDEHTGGAGESWVSAGPGEWLVRITGPQGGGVDYELDVVTRGGCADDGYERPFRNDVEERAVALGYGSYSAGACADDTDWFRWDGGVATISVEGDMVDARTGDGQALPLQVDGPTLIQVSPIGEGGAYTLAIEPVRSPAARCAAAEAIELGQPVEVGFDEAGADDFAPGCLGGGTAEQVYRIDLEVGGLLTARWAAELPTTRIALYGADCTAEPVACVAGPDALSASDLDAGTYFVVVDGPEAGTLTLSLDSTDLCEAPPTIELGVETEVTPGAAPGYLAGGCLEDGVGEAVVSFQLVEQADVQVSVTTDGTPVSASVRRAECSDAEAELECEFAFDPVLNLAGQQPGAYYAIIEGDPETVTVTVNTFQPSTFEDGCGADPTPLGVDRELTIIGDTSQFADSVDGTACDAAEGGRDAVYRFTLDVPATVSASIMATQDDFAATLSLRAGDCQGEPVDCGALIGSTTTAVLDAGDYALVIDGADADSSGEFQVSISTSPAE